MQPPPPPPPPMPAPFPPMPAPPRNWWQRNWKWFVPTGCLTALVLLVGFVTFILVVVTGAMKSSDAYKMAVERAEADPRVIEALGEPIREGMFTGGSINVSGGAGQANLSIPISGPKAKGTLYAVATKTAGEWQYSALNLKVAGSGETIDLNGQ